MTRADQARRSAYFAQHQLDELNPARHAPTTMSRALMPDAPEAQGARPRRRGSGFPARRRDTPVATLSGGEKARLLMGLADLRRRRTC